MERARILSGTSRLDRTTLTLLLGGMSCLAMLAMVAGCNTKSLGDPTEMGLNSNEPLVMPILTQIDPGVEGANDEFMQATPPTPADLVPTPGDYRIGPNDLLEVTIADLQAPNVDTFRRMRVSETGNINLPYLNEVKADGLTEAQLTTVIGDAYKRQGFLNNANVTVQVVEARGRAFSIVGAVGAPGEYAITQSDYRMLDALVTAHDTQSPTIEYAYIIRKISPDDSAAPATEAAPTSAPSTDTPTTGPSNEDLAPHSDAGGSANQPMNVLADPVSAGTMPSNNPLIDLAESTTQPATGPATESSTEAATTEPAPSGAPFEFNTPATSNNRIIRIPLIPLREGHLEYNVVIRPHDLIVVQNLPVGNYYMEGHVARPGAYTLTGTRVTVRQAVGAAAGLDALAIPERAELVRHVNPNTTLTVPIDLSKIFNGESPDLYLKPDDQLLVGTNAIAPFLAALRGSFRITYGFGFLYDRNFEVPSGVSQ